jgi:hypothetical protein
MRPEPWKVSEGSMIDHVHNSLEQAKVDAGAMMPPDQMAPQRNICDHAHGTLGERRAMPGAMPDARRQQG